MSERGQLDEEDLSTKHNQQKEDTRFFAADEHKGWTPGIEASQGQGEETADGLAMPREKKDESLRKAERLRKKADFEIIAREGLRRHTRNFLMIARKNDQGFARVGVVAGKKLGNAVERNRVKRSVREFFRRNKDHVASSTDYVIVGKKGAQDLPYAHVVAELSTLLELRKEDGRRN
jgi:ribonuclease P protein component